MSDHINHAAAGELLEQLRIKIYNDQGVSIADIDQLAAAIAADRVQLAATSSVKPWAEKMAEAEKRGNALDQRFYMHAEIADLRAQLAQQGQGDEARQLLQEFVDYHSKPAGMTLEVALDSDRLGTFLEGVEAREKDMVARAKAILSLAPASAQPAPVEVKIERNRVWVVKGNQSFMLAYVPDEGDDPAEMQAYADTLREALTGFTPDVNSASAQPAEQVSDAQADCYPSCGHIGSECDFPQCKSVAQQQAARVAVPDELLTELDWCIKNGVANPGMRTHAALVAARAMLAASPATVTEPAAPDDDEWDRNAERLTREMGIGGGKINPNATSIDDLFIGDDAAPAAQQAAPTELKAVQVFTCKGKGGEYELIGHSNGAGPKRGESIVVYRDVKQPDVFYHRSRDDFRERMEWQGSRAAPAIAGMVGQDAKDAALAEIFSAIDEAQRMNRYNESSFQIGTRVARLKCLADEYRAALATQQAQASSKGEQK